MWLSSLPHFPRPHALGVGALPGELGLLAEGLLDNDKGRQGQSHQTSAFSRSREPWGGVLIAFTEVWPPSGGISHKHQALPMPSGVYCSILLK